MNFYSEMDDKQLKIEKITGLTERAGFEPAVEVLASTHDFQQHLFFLKIQ